jgi:SAM-dependent methyltransferase
MTLASADLRAAGAFTGYRDRVYALVRGALRSLGAIPHAVDVGAGEGWYAKRLVDEGIVGSCDAVEVVRRKGVLVEPILYDGARLPMADRSADLVYAVDVVHHAPDPGLLLDEIARVAAKWILLKDHTYRTWLGRATLAVLDEIGNRRFGIRSAGTYQREWTWLPRLDSRGFRVHTMVYPAPCQHGVLGALTNPLQFLAVFERRDAD